MSTSPAFVADEARRCILFKHPVPDQWYLTTATNTSGEAVRWFVNSFYKDLNEAERYTRYTADAAQSPVGSRGLIFLPYLSGSRSPYYNPQARGSFFGLALRHGLPDLARSVMEGVAYELRDCFDVHRAVLLNQGMEITETRISGGIVRNPLWLQILADVLGCQLRVPTTTDLGTLGAAMNVAVGVGFYADHAQAAAHMVAIDKEIEPNLKNRVLYADGYALFKECYQSSVGLYQRLGEWASTMQSQ